ncbi:hypothetical protein ACFRFL_41680 [Streptomyces sp. NPDC056708]
MYEQVPLSVAAHESLDAKFFQAVEDEVDADGCEQEPQESAEQLHCRVVCGAEYALQEQDADTKGTRSSRTALVTLGVSPWSPSVPA